MEGLQPLRSFCPSGAVKHHVRNALATVGVPYLLGMVSADNFG